MIVPALWSTLRVAHTAQPPPASVQLVSKASCASLTTESVSLCVWLEPSRYASGELSIVGTGRALQEEYHKKTPTKGLDTHREKNINTRLWQWGGTERFRGGSHHKEQKVRLVYDSIISFKVSFCKFCRRQILSYAFSLLFYMFSITASYLAFINFPWFI